MNEYIELGKIVVGGIAASKPLSKLIEVAASAVGTMYKPRAMRNEAEAKAYEITKIAEANAKASIIQYDAENEKADRAKQRLFQLEMARQTNIENIVDLASMHLSEVVSDVPVDEDWKTRFFNKAKDISSEELQEIWAKILASEVNSPGKISLRTMDVLSSLSKKEAENFHKITSICTINGNILKVGDSLIDENDLSVINFQYEDIIRLRSAGLITHEDNLIVYFDMKEFVNKEDKLGMYFEYYDKKIFVYKPKALQIRLEQFLLTDSGIELLQIVGNPIDSNYLKALCHKLGREKFEYDIVEINRDL